MEFATFGFDHCDLSVMVAQRWKLFESLEHVMQHHHNPTLVEELGLEENSQAPVFVAALVRQTAMGLPKESGEATTELCERLALTETQVGGCETRGMRRYNDMYSSLLSSRT